MIELLQEYWKAFLYTDGQNITGLAMTMWLLSASIFFGFIVSIPLSIARVSPHFYNTMDEMRAAADFIKQKMRT